MALFKAYNKDVEVNGETVLSIINGMKTFQDIGVQIMKDNDITDPKPGQWYLQQAWLNAFKVISDKLGGSTLRMIGKQIPENAQWPPTVDDLQKALASIDLAYHMNHRLNNKSLFDPATGKITEGIGHYKCEITSPKSAKMTCDNPYPDQFDLGIIESVGVKFAKTGELVRVKIDESKGTRSSGKDSTVYLVTW